MSLILDALRKMEQERRSKRGNGQDLRPEVLRYRLAAQPKENPRYPLAIAAGIVLLCAGLGAGFMLKGRSAEQRVGETPSGVSVAQPQMAPPLAPAASPAAVAPAPVAASEPLPAPSVAVPAAVAAPAQIPVGGGMPAALPAEPIRRSSRATAPSPAPEAAPQSRAHQENAAAAAGGPEIVISGIAYQDERRMRRAVLNGTLVGEGAEVAGARVVEIKETKVRLSRGGHVFEVPFSSGLQSR